MSDQRAEKHPQEWVTGDEPLTGPQASYLETLAREAGEDVPEGLTKAEASELIERLQATTGRGADTGSGDTGPGDAGASAADGDDGGAGGSGGAGGGGGGTTPEEAGIVDQQAAAVEAAEEEDGADGDTVPGVTEADGVAGSVEAEIAADDGDDEERS